MPLPTNRRCRHCEKIIRPPYWFCFDCKDLPQPLKRELFKHPDSIQGIMFRHAREYLAADDRQAYVERMADEGAGWAREIVNQRKVA